MSRNPGGQIEGTDTSTGMNRTREAGGGKRRWAHLVLITESDRPLDGGARYDLTGVNEVVLGRGPDRIARREHSGRETRLTVALQNRLASKDHARVTRTADGWLLADESSKNGTFINGSAISEPSTLRPGDVFQVGRAFLTIRESALAARVDLSGDVLSADDERTTPAPAFLTLVPSLAERLSYVLSVARTADPVTIVGETGTGKEVLSKAVHEWSGRTGAFVGLNCAELAPSLVEGQLFGYVRGAYSGADQSDQGFIRSAQAGTLLLDEILDLPVAVQAKLLRVIQEGVIVPLGTSRAQKIDVRFLVASQQPLAAAVAASRFRPDLRARLERHVVDLLPLRERREDLGLLAASILRRHGVSRSDGVVIPSRDVLRMLAYPWPLNIRELENLLVDSLHRATDGVLDMEWFFAKEGGSLAAPALRLSEPERRARDELAVLLEKHRGNMTAVALEMNRHKQQVYRLMKRFGLDIGAFRKGGDAGV